MTVLSARSQNANNGMSDVFQGSCTEWATTATINCGCFSRKIEIKETPTIDLPFLETCMTSSRLAIYPKNDRGEIN